jgi:hypothetical protein
MKKKLLTREAFLSASKQLNKELVMLPELGGSVYVRELSGKQLLEYNERIEKLQKDNPELTPSSSLELMCLLVSLVTCDDEGNLLFTEEDVKELGNNSFAVLSRLTSKALELSGINPKAIDEVLSNLPNEKKDSSTTS